MHGSERIARGARYFERSTLTPHGQSVQWSESEDGVTATTRSSGDPEYHFERNSEADMNVNLTKFSLADTTPQQVIGMLKMTGSTDADVLFAAKEEFGSTFATQRFQGLMLLIVGALSSITIILAIIGVPVAIFGWWMWRKGIRNVATVEAAYSSYLGASGPNPALVVS